MPCSPVGELGQPAQVGGRKEFAFRDAVRYDALDPVSAFPACQGSKQLNQLPGK